MITPFTLFAASVSGVRNNNHYPNRYQVTDVTSLLEVAVFDHVAATYVNDRRSSANFVSSDCVVMDVDNDHTETPSEWITPEKLAELMAGVEFMTATSRNHMRPKGVVSARPRFHAYFPITQVHDANEYAGLKHRLASRFGFFDRNALDAGRFIYGTTSPQVTVHEGDLLLDAWLDAADERDVFASFDQSTLAIGEGSRNATLSRFAGRVLIRYGNSDQARDLFDRKAGLCEPPLSDSELESIWNSACRFAAKVAADPDYLPPEAYGHLDGLRPDDFTDVGQADALAVEYADSLRYSTATKWLAYQDGVWCEDELAAQRLAQEFTARQLAYTRQQLHAANQVMSRTGADEVMAEASSKKRGMIKLNDQQAEAFQVYEDALAFHMFVLDRRKSKNITASLKETAPILKVQPTHLDANPYLLNTPTATFDLRDGTSRSHDPADLITKQTSLDPGGQGAGLWREALETIFQGDTELIGYVQRVCGLAAIGKVLIEALIIAYGDGRNGKSTFWNTVGRVLGSYSGSISADTLTVGVRRNVKPELAEARGKRLLIAAETEEGVRLSTSTVKQLASTDQISAEKKFKDPFAFTPSHTLVLYTNHLPRVGGMDAGIWRRLIVIPFAAKIEGQADVKNYADYLYTHAGGAVLAWIMEGARLVHAENYHLTLPGRVVEATSAYREENNWLAHFLEASCQVGEGLSERAGDLYQAYRAWAKTTSGWAHPMADFNTAIEQAGYVRKKNKTGMSVYGLALKTEFEN